MPRHETQKICVFLILVLALALGLGGMPCIAQTPDFHAKWKLPDTPLGHRLGHLLEALSRDDEALTRDLIENGMHPSFLEMGPVEMHLEQFASMRRDLGAFKTEEVRLEGRYRGDLILLAESGSRRVLHVELEEIEPFRIFGINLQEHDPDLDIPEFTDLKTAEAYLNRLAENNKFSGVVVVEQKSKPRFARAYGMANKEKGIPNTLDTRFNVGSITKSFTAVAVMQLVEAGKVGLEDPMSKYLTGFPGEIADKVTVRHLLGMESGYGDYFGSRKFQERRTGIRTVDDYLDIFRDFSLDFEPGTDRQYSNTGYTVLGGIIEAASGMTYYDYVQEHIFKAAGMKGSSFPEYAVNDKRVAMGYTNDGPSEGTGYSDTNLDQFTSRGNPSGGSYSTAEDLLLFHRALRENKLVNEANATLILNFFQKGKKRPSRNGVAGGAPGVSAVYAEDVEKGYSVIVLSNYDEPLGEKIGEALFKMLEK